MVLLVTVHLDPVAKDPQIVLRTSDEILYGLAHFWDVAANIDIFLD